MGMGNRSTERISRSVFYLVLAVAAVVCGLFYMVEYDRPFESDPTFTAPMFTDVLIGFMLLGQMKLENAACEGGVPGGCFLRAGGQNRTDVLTFQPAPSRGQWLRLQHCCSESPI